MAKILPSHRLAPHASSVQFLGFWRLSFVRNFTRLLSLIVTLTFVFPYLTWAFEAEAYPGSGNVVKVEGKVLEIPDHVAQVLSSRQAGERVVIHVQDLHCNYEVQSGIAELVGHLSRAHGLKLVLLEGASERVNVTALSSYPQKEVREAVGKGLMKQGKVSGAEYAAASVGGVRLEGIEDERLYAQSRELVMGFLNDESQGYVYDLREIVNELGSRIYGPELAKLEEMKQANREGSLPVVKYGAYLAGYGQKLGVELGQYPALTGYVSKRRNVVWQEANPEAVFAELEGLEREIRGRLYTNAEQREYDQIKRRLDVMEKLLNISATVEERAEYAREREAYRVEKILGFVRERDASGELVVDPEVAGLNGYLKQVEAFYRLADERSEAFVERTEGALEKSGEKLAVLVTGGFHTEQVLAGLTRRGLTYVSVRARQTQEDLVNPYFALIRERKTPLEKLLAENQNILALAPNFPQVGEEGVLSAEAEAAQGEGVRVFLQVLRMALQEAEVAYQVRSGKSALAEIRGGWETAQGAYPYRSELTIDWERAEAGNGVYLLPFTGIGVTAVIRREGSGRAGEVELSRVELPGSGYEVVMLESGAAAQARERLLAAGGVSARGAGVRPLVLGLMTPAAVATAGGIVLAGVQQPGLGRMLGFADFSRGLTNALAGLRSGPVARRLEGEAGRVSLPLVIGLAGAAVLAVGVGAVVLAGGSLFAGGSILAGLGLGAPALLLVVLPQGPGPEMGGGRGTPTRLGQLAQMKSGDEQREAVNALAWAARNAGTAEDLRALVAEYEAALQQNAFQSDGQALAVLASLMAAAYQNTRIGNASYLIQAYVLANDAITDRLNLAALDAVNLIAHATQKPEIIPAQILTQPVLHGPLLAVLAEPSLVLYAYDPQEATTRAQIQRGRRISRFYQTLQITLRDQGWAAGVDYMRTHLNDPALFDQPTRAATESQLVASEILYAVSQGGLGFETLDHLARGENASPLFRASVKNVAGMREVAALDGPATLYLGFPAFGEQVRFFNEDFLRLKIRQLARLAALNPNLRVELIVSDDEYAGAHPKEKSHAITLHNAELFQVFLSAYLGNGRETGDAFESWMAQVNDRMRVRVVGVEKAIDREAARPGSVPVLSAFVNKAVVTRSRRCGSNWYVLWVGEQLAAGRPGERAYIAYTDADISSNLLQTGLLMRALEDGATVAIASTEIAGESVLTAKSTFRRLMSLVYNLAVNWTLFSPVPLRRVIRDTQRGYKMFAPDTFRNMVRNFTVYPHEFAVDTEMLAQAHVQGETIREVPIAWMASEAESTVRDSDSRDMLYYVLAQRRLYVRPSQGWLGRLAGLPAVLVSGLLLYGLSAKLDMDSEQHGAAIARFRAGRVAAEARLTGKTEDEINAQMTAFYVQAGLDDYRFDQYAEGFLAKEPERIRQDYPQQAEALIAELNAVDVNAYAPTASGKMFSLLKHLARPWRYGKYLAEVGRNLMPAPGRVHPFRAVQGYRAAAVSALLSLALVGASFLLRQGIPDLAVYYQALSILTLLGGGFFSLGALNYWKLGRTVKEAMLASRLEKYWAAERRTRHQDFLALRRDKKAYQNWIDSISSRKMRALREEASGQAIALSDGWVDADAMRILEQEQPFFALQVKKHEKHRNELLGMLALLPTANTLRSWIRNWPKAAARREAGKERRLGKSTLYFVSLVIGGIAFLGGLGVWTFYFFYDTITNARRERDQTTFVLQPTKTQPYATYQLRDVIPLLGAYYPVGATMRMQGETFVIQADPAHQQTFGSVILNNNRSITVDFDQKDVLVELDAVSTTHDWFFIVYNAEFPDGYIKLQPDTRFAGQLRFRLSDLGLTGVRELRFELGISSYPKAINAQPTQVVFNAKTSRILVVDRLAPDTAAERAPVTVAPHASLTAGGIKTVAEAQAVRDQAQVIARQEGPKIIPHAVWWYSLDPNYRPPTETDEWGWFAFQHNPLQNARNIASVHHPLLGPFSSSDPEYMRWLIRSAKAMGMNGMSIDYYAERRPYEQQLPALFRAAEQEGDFTLSLMYETRLAKDSQGQPDVQLMKQHIRHILDTYGVSPAFQRLGGVPVIYLFGMLSTGFYPWDYEQIVKELEAEGYVFILIGDSTVHPAYYKVMNGLHEWINMGTFLRSQKAAYWQLHPDEWEQSARSWLYKVMETRPSVFSIASIYGEFDDRELGGGDWGRGVIRRLQPSGGNLVQAGNILNSTMEYAVANQDKLLWAKIMTWDDWNEGTEMEPSLEKGFSSFFALMEFSARYRGFQADPEAVIRYAEDYLRAKNNGRIPAEAQAVLDQARAYLPTVRANIRKGLLEYQARQTPQPQPTAVPHRFRAVTGYLAAAAAGTVSLALTGLSAATLGLAPAGASLFLLWPLLGLVGGAYLAWGAVNYFRVGRAVEQAMGDALIERYYESRAGPGTKSFAALRNDPAAFAAWLESQPVEALSDILQQARTSAIAWSDGRVEPAAMAALEKANPRAAAQVRLHESFRREIPGLLALLPGLRDRFLAQAPQATAFRYSGQVSVQNMSRELNRLGVTWSTSGSRLELPAELSRLREYVFERDLAETSDELGVDPEQLWRTTVTQPLRYVLAELMRNAFDSQVLAGVERPIGLDVERRDGQWVIEISDNGLGIGGVRQDDLGVLRVTPKDRPQDQAAYQKISGGLGLGLPWTQLLVRLHGGSVEYLPEGREGYRTTVRLVFPEASLRTSAWFDRATPGERVQARATERPHPFRALSGYAATAVSGLVSVGLLGASLAFGYALPSWNTWLALLPVMGLFAGAYFAAGAVNYFRISRAVQAAMFETLLQRRYEGQAAPGGPTFAELRLSSREYRTWLDSLPGAVLASLRRQARNAVIAWSDGRLDAEAMAVLERTRPEIANRIRYHETLRNDLLGYLALLPGLYRLFGLPRYTPEILPLPAALARETRDLNERDRRILRTAFQHGAISTTITLPLSRIRQTLLQGLIRSMSPLFVAVYTFIARNLAGLPRTELYLDIYQFDLAQRYREKGLGSVATLHADFGSGRTPANAELFYRTLNQRFEPGREAKVILHIETLDQFIADFARREGLEGLDREIVLLRMAERARANQLTLLFEPVRVRTPDSTVAMLEEDVARVRALREAWQAAHPDQPAPVAIVFDAWHWITDGYPELHRRFRLARTQEERDAVRLEVLYRLEQAFGSMEDMIAWIHFSNEDQHARSWRYWLLYRSQLFGDRTLIPNLQWLRFLNQRRPDLLYRMTFELSPLYFVRSLFGFDRFIRRVAQGRGDLVISLAPEEIARQADPVPAPRPGVPRPRGGDLGPETVSSAADADLLRTLYANGSISTTILYPLSRFPRPIRAGLAALMRPFFRTYIWFAQAFFGITRLEIYADTIQIDRALGEFARGRLPMRSIHTQMHPFAMDSIHRLVQRPWTYAQPGRLVIHSSDLQRLLEYIRQREDLDSADDAMQWMLSTADRNNVRLMIEAHNWYNFKFRLPFQLEEQMAFVRAWRERYQRDTGRAPPIFILFDPWHFIHEERHDLYTAFSRARTPEEMQILRAQVFDAIVGFFERHVDMIDWLHLSNTANLVWAPGQVRHGNAMFGDDTLLPLLDFVRYLRDRRPDLLDKLTFEFNPAYWVRSLSGFERRVRLLAKQGEVAQRGLAALPVVRMVRAFLHPDRTPAARALVERVREASRGWTKQVATDPAVVGRWADAFRAELEQQGFANRSLADIDMPADLRPDFAVRVEFNGLALNAFEVVRGFDGRKTFVVAVYNQDQQLVGHGLFFAEEDPSGVQFRYSIHEGFRSQSLGGQTLRLLLALIWQGQVMDARPASVTYHTFAGESRIAAFAMNFALIRSLLLRSGFDRRLRLDLASFASQAAPEAGLVRSRQLALEARPDTDWASEMVLNPGLLQDRRTGRLHMLFRATGPYTQKQLPGKPLPYPIFLGYAYSDDQGRTWHADFSRPALAPRLADTPEGLLIENAEGRKVPNHANGAIEDPRLFYLDGKSYLAAACRMFPPGAYWVKDDPLQAAPDWARSPENPYGRAASDNVTVNVLFEVNLEALAAGNYEQAFSYIGPLTDPAFGENRDVVVFPERLMIGGEPQVVQLHRPETPGAYPGMPEGMRPSIFIRAARSLGELAAPAPVETVLAEPLFPWERERIGASAPPLRISPTEWLVSYHGKQDARTGYTQSFLILEEQPDALPRVKHRCPEGVLAPQADWEQPGKFRTPVLFVTGMVRIGDELLVSYGAADERAGVLRMDYQALLDHVRQFDEQGGRAPAGTPAGTPANAEKAQGRAVGALLSDQVLDVRRTGDLLQGGYRQPGYGVPGGSVINGSFGFRGLQGYFTRSETGEATGKQAFLDGVTAFRAFFERRNARLEQAHLSTLTWAGRARYRLGKLAGRSLGLRVLAKTGIGGQHTPFQGLRDAFRVLAGRIIRNTRVLGEYELGKDYEAALQELLASMGAEWTQLAVDPSSKSGSTDETMLIYSELLYLQLKHIGQSFGLEGERFAEVVFETLHAVNFSDGKERPAADLFKVEPERFGTSSLIDLIARNAVQAGLAATREQVRDIFSVVIGNTFFETTNRPDKSRLAAFLQNSGLDQELGVDARNVLEMFDNVGGRWTADLHMMAFLAFYGLDAEAYWEARNQGVEEVRAGIHPSVALANKLVDRAITDIALVVPDALFWFGKSIEQNFNESIWQPGFANLVVIKQSQWQAQRQHYQNQASRMVINLTDAPIDPAAYQTASFPVGAIHRMNPRQLTRTFARLTNLFYGLTSTTGDRLIARALLKAGYTAADVDLNDLSHPATRIVQSLLYLRQPYVELGKGLLEARLQALQAEEARQPGAIDRALEDIHARARAGELEASVPGLEVPSAVTDMKSLARVIQQAVDYASAHGRKFVPFIYLEGEKFTRLRDALTELGIEWVLQGTGDQHISYQQVLAQPQKYLPFIISFVPEKTQPGRRAIGFAKGYLDRVSPNLVRDYFAEASYRALVEVRNEDFKSHAVKPGQGLFLRLTDTPENLALLLDAARDGAQSLANAERGPAAEGTAAARAQERVREAFGPGQAELYSRLYREVVRPRLAGKPVQALYFGSGGNVAPLLLSSNFESAVLVDRRPLGQERPWAGPGTEAEARRAYFDVLRRENYPRTETLSALGTLWFQLKWELEVLGVPPGAVRIMRPADRLWQITFPWGYPGETPVTRTIWLAQQEMFPQALPDLLASGALAALSGQGVDLLRTNLLFDKGADTIRDPQMQLPPHLPAGSLVLTDQQSVAGHLSQHPALVRLLLPDGLGTLSRYFGRVGDTLYRAPGTALEEIAVFETKPGPGVRQPQAPGGQEPALQEQMLRFQQILPEPLNQPLRGFRFLPLRLFRYGLRSVLFASDTATSGNLTLRLPLQALAGVLAAGFALAALAAGALAGGRARQAVTVDDLSPRFEALKRTLVLPDAIAAREYNVKQIRFRALSELGTAWSRLGAGQWLGAFAENGEAASRGEWANLYVPDQLLQAMNRETPAADGTLRTAWSRFRYRAQAFLFGVIVGYQAEKYFAESRWDGVAEAFGRRSLRTAAEAEAPGAANLLAGERLETWLAGRRTNVGISAAELTGLVAEYLAEARQALNQQPDQSLLALRRAFQRELEQGAEPNLATLLRVTATLGGVEAGSLAGMLRALAAESVELSPELSALVRRGIVSRLIAGEAEIKAGAALRNAEAGTARAGRAVYVQALPAAYQEQLAEVRAALQALAGRPGSAGLIQRLALVEQALSAVQGTPAGKLGLLSGSVGQQVEAELARQARGEQARLLPIGEDLSRNVIGVRTGRVRTVTVDGVELAQPQVYEVSAPAAQAVQIQDLLSGTLPQNVAAKDYAGEIERLLTVPRPKAGVLARVAQWLPTRRMHQLALRSDPMGYLAGVLAGLNAERSPLGQLLLKTDSPLVQAYLRYAAQPASRKAERDFVKAMLRAVKAQAQTPGLEAQAGTAASLALFSELAGAMKSLSPGVAIGVWDRQAPAGLADRAILLPGVLLELGGKGALGAYYDLLHAQPAKLDENALEKMRRRLFRSTTVAA